MGFAERLSNELSKMFAGVSLDLCILEVCHMAHIFCRKRNCTRREIPLSGITARGWVAVFWQVLERSISSGSAARSGRYDYAFPSER